MSEEKESTNWISVINFLQKEHTKISIQQQQWKFQRQSLLDKINRLQAELDASRITIADLLNRNKLLEIALFQSKSKKNGHSKPFQSEAKKGELTNLIEQYKLEGKVKNQGHQDFLKKILSEIGIDSKQVIFKEQKDLFQHHSQKIKRNKPFIMKKNGKIVSHLDSVRGLWKNQNSDALISISEDCLVKFWSYKNVMAMGNNEHIDPLKSFRQHTGPLFAIDGGNSPFNPEQSIIFTGGSEGLIKYWSVNNKNPADSAQAIGYMNNSLKQVGKNEDNEDSGVIWSLSLRNDKLLSTSSDGYVRLFQIKQKLETQQQFFTRAFKEKQFKATSAIWIGDNIFMNGCSNAARGQLWDTEGKLRQFYTYQIEKGREPESCQINHIRYSQSMKMAVFGCQDANVRIFSPNFPKMVRKIPHTSPISAIQFLNDWQMACGSSDGCLSVWDLRNYQCLHTFKNVHSHKYQESLMCLLSPESNCLLSGGAQGLIRTFK